MPIAENVRRIQRELGPITLIAVTKGRSPAEVLELLQSGITHIGENRLQEAEGKFAKLDGNPLFSRCAKHFIGNVQSNKAKRIAELFDAVQSVDSEKVAGKLSAAATALGKTLEVFLEVNATGEEQKHGIPPSRAAPLADTVKQLLNLKLVGIMGMGPQASEAEIRQCFRTLKALQRQLGLPQLSMGMSADYRIAIAEGATMVRIGSALFE